MAWIDCEKAYDMVSKTWIIKCLRMYKTTDKIKKMKDRIDSERTNHNRGKKKNRYIQGRLSRVFANGPDDQVSIDPRTTHTKDSKDGT